MSYPYYPAECKGALCLVHGDPRDTSVLIDAPKHWAASGHACVCDDGRHDPIWQCAGEKTLPGIPNQLAATQRIPFTLGPCCGADEES